MEGELVGTVVDDHGTVECHEGRDVGVARQGLNRTEAIQREILFALALSFQPTFIADVEIRLEFDQFKAKRSTYTRTSARLLRPEMTTRASGSCVQISTIRSLTILAIQP